MNLCQCGCGTEVKKSWVRGHHFRKKQEWPTPKTELDRLTLEQVEAIIPLTVKPPAPSAPAEGPPEYPHPIDRSRWRLAEDRPGTPQTNPWIKTQCHSCLLPMWTKDSLSTWENGGVCEECGWLLREDVGKQTIKLNTARPPYDPFA